MSDAEKIEKLRITLGTLIAWMSQSSVTPISISEANELFEMLEELKATNDPS